MIILYCYMIFSATSDRESTHPTSSAMAQALMVHNSPVAAVLRTKINRHKKSRQLIIAGANNVESVGFERAAQIDSKGYNI
ncbi:MULTISPECIES: hypothetical protein [Agrobacterium]|nr:MULTISPECIES: hypothetical protein [Agrobacterium]PZU74767.1 MAG: hypothetical protein DI546_10260 [Rhizobium sp.]RSC41548.1 hypothetical protein EGT36_01035 [Agrobacterium sp. FDAARGOS_525]HAU73961.1 hypothetical protein [Agrobacterium sp.]MDH2221456.1 hypothetical protein [Agrobacterium sp. GD03638]OJH60863.1 hypothetical protein BA725_05525 [Agrobacterium pusense]